MTNYFFTRLLIKEKVFLTSSVRIVSKFVDLKNKKRYEISFASFSIVELLYFIIVHALLEDHLILVDINIDAS